MKFDLHLKVSTTGGLIELDGYENKPLLVPILEESVDQDVRREQTLMIIGIHNYLKEKYPSIHIEARASKLNE